MLNLDEIKRSIRSLLVHRLRTLLSTLGILFGVAAVIAMLSIGEGAKEESLEQIQQLGINSILIRQTLALDGNEKRGFTWKDIDALSQNIPSLLHCAPLKTVEAAFSGTPSPEILAITRSFCELKDLQLAEGRFICDLDQKDKRMVCVLGYDIAKSFGKVGHVGRSIRLSDRYFEIVGILKSTLWKPSKNAAMATRNLNQTIFIPFGVEASILPREQQESHPISEIVLEVQHPKQLEMAVKQVNQILEKLHDKTYYQISIPIELLHQADLTQRTFNMVLGSIAALSLLIGGIGIMNIMLATVSERTREIGIRRAVGANQRHILQQFLLETLLLTLLGALLGILVGIGVSAAISYFAGWRTIVTLWSITLSLVMSSLVGFCSGLYPAYQAARMDPIQALRV